MAAVLKHAHARCGSVLQERVDLIRWWRDVGGTAVSFGSDAHLPQRVGDRFKLAVDVVEAAGFRAGRDPYDFWRV